jgi:AcrR family transcriptional regulator
VSLPTTAGAEGRATTPSPTRDRDTSAPSTRDRLLGAARHVIETGGYGTASVLAIAAEAGVAAGTLYRHFPSKGELYVEVFRDVCGREMAAARGAAAQTDGAAARIDAIITTFARRALANPTLAWSLIAEPVDPAVERVRLEFREDYRETVATLLAEAVADGLAPEQDVALTAAALVGSANEILAGPLAPARQGHRDDDTTVEALRDLWRRTAGLPPAEEPAGALGRLNETPKTGP